MPEIVILGVATKWRDHLLDLWRGIAVRSGRRAVVGPSTPAATRLAQRLVRLLRRHDPLFAGSVAGEVAGWFRASPQTSLPEVPWWFLVGPELTGKRLAAAIRAARSRCARPPSRGSPLAVLAADAPALRRGLRAMPKAALADPQVPTLLVQLLDILQPFDKRAPAKSVRAREHLVQGALQEERARRPAEPESERVTSRMAFDFFAECLDALTGLRVLDQPSDEGGRMVSPEEAEDVRRRGLEELAAQVERAAWWNGPRKL